VRPPSGPVRCAFLHFSAVAMCRCNNCARLPAFCCADAGDSTFSRVDGFKGSYTYSNSGETWVEVCLCCAVLCCAVLCCDVLCCTVPVLCCACAFV
jgi:hypothetical protein